MSQRKFLKGQTIEILPEFQDTGDDEYTWIVLDDEEKGRVTIMPIDSKLNIKPTYVVKTEWIKHHPLW